MNCRRATIIVARTIFKLELSCTHFDGIGRCVGSYPTSSNSRLPSSGSWLERRLDDPREWTRGRPLRILFLLNRPGRAAPARRRFSRCVRALRARRASPARRECRDMSFSTASGSTERPSERASERARRTMNAGVVRELVVRAHVNE